MSLHVANSAATIRGIGTNLDYIRPGIALYGLPPDTADKPFLDFGLKPLLEWRAHPTFVKVQIRVYRFNKDMREEIFGEMRMSPI